MEAGGRRGWGGTQGGRGRGGYRGGEREREREREREKGKIRKSYWFYSHLHRHSVGSSSVSVQDERYTDKTGGGWATKSKTIEVGYKMSDGTRVAYMYRGMGG